MCAGAAALYPVLPIGSQSSRGALWMDNNTLMHLCLAGWLPVRRRSECQAEDAAPAAVPVVATPSPAETAEAGLHWPPDNYTMDWTGEDAGEAAAGSHAERRLAGGSGGCGSGSSSGSKGPIRQWRSSRRPAQQQCSGGRVWPAKQGGLISPNRYRRRPLVNTPGCKPSVATGQASASGYRFL